MRQKAPCLAAQSAMPAAGTEFGWIDVSGKLMKIQRTFPVAT